jgi:hypothetical protein
MKFMALTKEDHNAVVESIAAGRVVAATLRYGVEQDITPTLPMLTKAASVVDSLCDVIDELLKDVTR